MKRFYLFVLYAVVCFSAYPAYNIGCRNADKSFKNSLSFGKLEGKRTPVFKSPLLRAAPDDDIVTNPEGESQLFSRSSISAKPMGDTPVDTKDYNFAGVLVFDDAGKVYLRNPFSQFITGSYLEGDVVKNGDSETMVFELPQKITVYEADGEYYDLYACMLAFSDNGEDMETAEDQDLVFVKVDDRWVMADPDAIMGLTFDDSSWTGFAEMQMIYSPLEDKVAQIPEGLNYEQWMMTYGNEGHFVEIAIDGEKCYMKNMLDTSEKSLAPIVGTVTESGFHFPSPQFLGVNEDNSYLTYYFAGEVRDTYLEDINTTVRTFIPADNMSFAIQPDGVLYKSDISAMFTPVPDMDSDYFWSMGVVETPSIQKSVADNLVPANPSVVDYRYYPNYMFGYVSFEIPMLNTDGQILDTSRLYYNVYLDGEILEFDNDEYPLFKKTMTDIPYDFEDGRGGSGDIKMEGSKHTVILYREGLEELGIQSYYVDEAGTRYYSDLVSSFVEDIDSGVDSIDAEVEVSVDYFDLSGRKVLNPEKGIYLKVINLSDGTKTVRKVIF